MPEINYNKHNVFIIQFDIFNEEEHESMVIQNIPFEGNNHNMVEPNYFSAWFLMNRTGFDNT